MESLPDRTWAVMVHKIYQARVVEYLMGRRPHTANDDAAVVVLDTVEPKGPSQGRRGYVVVLCRAVQRIPTSHLSALARQNISWTAALQHVVTLHHPHNNNNHGWTELATALYTTLLLPLHTVTTTTTTTTDMLLRIDVHPRALLETLCGQLQQAAAAATGSTWRSVDDDDPFEGPIPMTASRSQCTVRLTVVIITTNTTTTTSGGTTSCPLGQEQYPPQPTDTTTTTTTTTCYWGIDRRPTDNDAIDLRLNHESNQELNIVAMLPENGNDPPTHNHKNNNNNNNSSLSPPLSPPLLPITTPLSRAHYKMLQVWHDILQPLQHPRGGAALDLGASPGGWIQVLQHDMQCAPIYAVDPALLAARVLRHGAGVVHMPCMLHQFADHAARMTHTPLRTLVCDASVLWAELWQSLLDHIFPHIASWQFPAVLVLTCKLPYRTAGSIARHVAAMHAQLPAFIDKMRPHFGTAAEEVSIESQFLHLFANSESERTLVLIVKEK